MHPFGRFRSKPKTARQGGVCSRLLAPRLSPEPLLEITASGLNLAASIFHNITEGFGFRMFGSLYGRLEY